MTTKELTQLIKRGKFIELPCVVGDIIYGIEKFRFNDIYRYKIIKLIVNDVKPFGKVENGTIYNIIANKDTEETFLYYSFEDFGKTIFDTEERALVEVKRLNSSPCSFYLSKDSFVFTEGTTVKAERKGEKLSSLRVGDKVLIKFPNAKYYLSAQIKRNEEIGEYIYIKGNKIPMTDIIKNYEK